MTATPLHPPGSRERHLDVPAGRLRVLLAGDAASPGLPLVLVHGGGADNASISWFRLLEPLGRTRLVVAPDLPGFGGSIDVPPVGGPRALADVVTQVMDALGLPRAIVGGVSMGGDVALNVGLEHPDRVAGLVLVAPGGLAARVGGRATHTAAWLAARTPDWVLLSAARFANRFVDTALRAMVKDPATLPPEIIPEFARESRHPLGGIAYGRYNQATIGRRGLLNDVSDRVAELRMPTLVVHGVDDPLVAIENSRRAVSRMPSARLVAVPDSGHWVQLEAHDLVLGELTRFLDELDAR